MFRVPHLGHGLSILWECPSRSHGSTRISYASSDKLILNLKLHLSQRNVSIFDRLRVAFLPGKSLMKIPSYSRSFAYCTSRLGVLVHRLLLQSEHSCGTDYRTTKHSPQTGFSSVSIKPKQSAFAHRPRAENRVFGPHQGPSPYRFLSGRTIRAECRGQSFAVFAGCQSEMIQS